MSDTCKCELCTKVFPALRWMRDNAPAEHFKSLEDYCDHRELVETDAAMYQAKVAECNGLSTRAEKAEAEVERMRALCADACRDMTTAEYIAWIGKLRAEAAKAKRGEGE